MKSENEVKTILEQEKIKLTKVKQELKVLEGQGMYSNIYDIFRDADMDCSLIEARIQAYENVLGIGML